MTLDGNYVANNLSWLLGRRRVKGFKVFGLAERGGLGAGEDVAEQAGEDCAGAERFRNGLCLVTTDHEIGYINAAGEFVWRGPYVLTSLGYDLRF
jgi:hypothetical protein